MAPTSPTSKRPRAVITQFLQGMTGVNMLAEGRVRKLTTLGDRCADIEHELNHWKVLWNTPGLEVAGKGVQEMLENISKEISGWEHRSFISRVVMDDQIDSKIEAWEKALQTWMEDYHRNILHELLLSSREVTVAVLKQGEILAVLQNTVKATPVNGQQWVGAVIDEVQNVLWETPPRLTSEEREAIFEALHSILTFSTIPASIRLEGEVNVHPSPVITNSRSDIYRGDWRGLVVAVKRLRDPNSNTRRAEKFLLEGTIWRMLRHPNVVPFYGVEVRHVDGNTNISLVSQWISGGDIMNFLVHRPDANRLDLITHTAYGIVYLHRRHIVHGAIRGSNILVDERGTPMLTDFGLSSSTGGDGNGVLTDGMSSSEPSTTIRWLAPELTIGSDAATEASDVFSFGRTILEILTGEKPFKAIKNTWTLAGRLFAGDLEATRPIDPRIIARGLSDDMWALLVETWKRVPEERPKMGDVMSTLEGL